MTPVVIKRISDVMVASGFRTRASGILTTAINDDISGWLGLNVTSRDHVVEANVVVGVLSEKVERFILQLMGSAIFGKWAPTISLHIGYLMPGKTYHPWFFEGEPDQYALDDINGAVREFALPFMRRDWGLAELAECQRDPTFASHHQAIYRLPSCHALLGNYETATAVCDEYVHELHDRRDEAAEQYRRFVEALKEEVRSQ